MKRRDATEIEPCSPSLKGRTAVVGDEDVESFQRRA